MRIGIDLGGTKIEGVLLGNDGSVLEKTRINTPQNDYQRTLAALCDTVAQLQTRSAGLSSVGIGTPGTLSTDTAAMKNCNSTCLNGEALKQDIEKVLGYEVRLENDANCFALSEATLGAGKNAYSVFGVILGTGTGGGIVIDGNLLQGSNAIAGEWGHNPIPSSASALIEADRICYCGRSNCIETILSGRGLSQTFNELTGIDLQAIDIAARAAAKDPQALACLEHYSEQLAICLATVINIVDPEVMVLGGGLSNIEALYRQVPSHLARHVFTDILHTRLLAATFGDASGARGAACLWPERG
jgi:fructokinase